MWCIAWCCLSLNSILNVHTVHIQCAEIAQYSIKYYLPSTIASGWLMADRNDQSVSEDHAASVRCAVSMSFGMSVNFE